MTEPTVNGNPATIFVVDNEAYEEFVRLLDAPLKSTNTHENLKRCPSPYTTKWPHC
jgi:uncharacterized protein (DUF1778 family)